MVPIINHIKLILAADPANIFSRKMHKLRQAELKVKYLPATLPIAYEMDKLILQGLPGGVEEDFLNLFVATCLQISEEQFSISVSKDKVLITFSKEYSLNGECVSGRSDILMYEVLYVSKVCDIN